MIRLEWQSAGSTANMTAWRGWRVNAKPGDRDCTTYQRKCYPGVPYARCLPWQTAETFLPDGGEPEYLQPRRRIPHPACGKDELAQPGANSQ